ncbi:arginine--tRNA ligase [Patescibacteria group bacterium]|nr:arginine--tRNA ligase [Patescibacteria group bacterium]MCL5409300.1 arginine--tRNA ligase [Patescibacteria group bacterium]
MTGEEILNSRELLKESLIKAVKALGFPATDIVLSIPENPSFGDYTSNIALQLAKLKSKTSKQTSFEIAKEIMVKMGNLDFLEKIEIAEPGFINFTLKDQALIPNLLSPVNLPKVSKKQRILVEFAHPNTHKAFHIGHLRNIILGESICRMLEGRGEDVYRANYQGDIGPHVAKAIWGVKKLAGQTKPEQMDTKQRAQFLGQAYALGSKAYQDDVAAKKEIEQINSQIYQRDPQIWDLWMQTRSWSLDYFQTIYHQLGTRFDRLFFESEVDSEGKKIVQQFLAKGIFAESEGAVIFNGEEFGLHKRVFITSQGNPTYEAKDLGLAKQQYEAFAFNLAIHVVANEQTDYFKVLFKALELIFPQIGPKEFHLAYGMVNLPSGKMSSRTGEVITGESLLSEVRGKVAQVMADSQLETKDEVVEQVTVGAVKFAMLKIAPSSDMIFDIARSVSLQGDSGPYLQYTFARTQSVLKNAPLEIESIDDVKKFLHLEKQERLLLIRLDYFDIVVQQASEQYRPNLIATYLLELTKDYNLFYQKYRILNSDNVEFRLLLTAAVGQVIKEGLRLLGIEAPVQM